MNDNLVMIVAGEASADAHAAALVRELYCLRPGLHVYGAGGPELAAAGAELLFDFSRTGVVGITELLPRLGDFFRAYQRLGASAAARRPVGVILLDLPDFNLFLAAKIRQVSPQSKIIYYISPQVWAWRPGRVKTIASRANAMLVIFPFEVDIYKAAGMDVEFVGHPLRDRAVPSAPREELRRQFGIAESEGPVVAVLPGSRRAEVARYLPLMARAAVCLVQNRPGMKFLLAQAPTVESSLLHQKLGDAAPLVKVIEGRTCDVLTVADVALAASGTVTLEAALLGTPMVVVGAVSWPTYLLVKPFTLVRHYSLPNVIAGREIVPELIQREARPERLAAEAERLLADPEKSMRIREELRRIAAALGEKGASRRAAEAVARRLWVSKDAN